jgi:5-methylcytosine-specific restriction endonuclease McrA
LGKEREYELLCELYGAPSYEVQEFVMKLFDYRCPGCGGKADTVHEIIPRSRGKRAWEFSNRVAICHPCHTEFHRLGASQDNVAKWQELRDNWLRKADKNEPG